MRLPITILTALLLMASPALGQIDVGQNSSWASYSQAAPHKHKKLDKAERKERRLERKLARQQGSLYGR
jgi:hypothetical protein